MHSSSTDIHLSGRAKRYALTGIVVVALALMLLAAEVVVRMRQQAKYGSAATFENQYAVDAKTGLRVPVPNLSTGRISVNSLGFRGPEIAMPKPAGTLRVAFLGASTTWCAEVSGNDHVWAHLATSELSQTFPHVRVDYVNAGVPGYTMSSVLKSFEQRVAPLEPDVVVIYEAANNLSAELRQLAASQGIIPEPRMQELSWPSRYSVLWNLVEKNLKVLSAQRAASRNTKPLSLPVDGLGAEYRHLLTQVVRAAQRRAKFVAIATFSIQPRAAQSLDAQMRASASAFVYTPFVTPAVLIESYDRYNDIIRQVARETGAFLIEGEKDIPGDSQHFADTVHFTDEGSKAMARRVSRALSSSTELRSILAKPAAQ
jgi:lysophospholipase L1-like esterase